MLCTGANFAKKNSCLVARIVLYYTAGLHLLTFHILEPYPFKDIALGRLSLKRGFNGCGHRLGGCDGLGGFDWFSGCDRLGGFDGFSGFYGLGGFSGFDGLGRFDGFGRFGSRLP